MNITRRQFNNGGSSYALLPTIVVIPLVQVVDYMVLTPSNIFDDPMAARTLYPTKGFRLRVEFYTWTQTFDVTWSKNS